jgi:hemolysin activation/secretion protein
MELFFNKSKSEQSAFSAKANYFTNLIEMGDWKFRQFVKSQLIIGNKRLNSNADQLTLNEGNGISGFNTSTLFGTKKLLFTFQTQSYSPYNIWGFRFNPYLNYTIGMLGNAESGFRKSKAYSQFGVGVIIRNDYLVFSSFQLSLAFYPVVPDSGENIFKTNAINSEDFGFQDFEINKPESVFYK